MGDFYFIRRDGRKTKIVHDLWGFHSELLSQLENHKAKLFIFDSNNDSPFEKKLNRFAKVLDDNSENLYNILCNDLIGEGKCMEHSDLKAVVFERDGNDILVRAIMCSEIIEDENMLHIEILCGTGGAGMIIDKLKELILTQLEDISGISFETIGEPNTQLFYHKKGFRAEVSEGKEILQKIKKMPKNQLKQLYETNQSNLYLILGIYPTLYWYKDNSEELFYTNDWDAMIKQEIY